MAVSFSLDVELHLTFHKWYNYLQWGCIQYKKNPQTITLWADKFHHSKQCLWFSTILQFGRSPIISAWTTVPGAPTDTTNPAMAVTFLPPVTEGKTCRLRRAVIWSYPHEFHSTLAIEEGIYFVLDKIFTFFNSVQTMLWFSTKTIIIRHIIYIYVMSPTTWNLW